MQYLLTQEEYDTLKGSNKLSVELDKVLNEYYSTIIHYAMKNIRKDEYSAVDSFTRFLDWLIQENTRRMHSLKTTAPSKT